MFTDPQSVTISGTAHTLARVSSDGSQSKYQNADGSVTEVISHGNGRRFRRTFRINHSKVAPDPLFPAQNAPYSMSAMLIVDVPPTGYSVAEQKAVVDGLIAQLNASSGALITKFLGAENCHPLHLTCMSSRLPLAISGHACLSGLRAGFNLR